MLSFSRTEQNSPESERSVFREKECEFSVAHETKQSQLKQGCSAVSTGTNVHMIPIIKEYQNCYLFSGTATSDGNWLIRIRLRLFSVPFLYSLQLN